MEKAAVLTNKFYKSISTANPKLLGDILHQDLELIIPLSGGVLSGHYLGKDKFLNEVLPLVFSCVNQHEIIFCENYKILMAEGDTAVAIAQNNGFAATGKRYDQIYIHILTFKDNRLFRLIEYFDSTLANDALWGDLPNLISDHPFTLSSIR